jgi:hypothetical protein
MTQTRYGNARRATPLATLVCGLLAALAVAPGAVASAGPTADAAARGPEPVKPPAAATLEGCQSASQQSERAATFVGEMTAVPGAARMLMRIDVLERSGGEPDFRSVSYPGLDAWLHAVAGVKTYKNLQRVTDLAAPAEYRAEIHFHWLNARGHLLKSSVLRTPVCTQSLPEGSEDAASTPTGPSVASAQ